MSEKYEVTKEAILAMAEKCPEAKEVLRVGFPQAFEGEKTFDLLKLKNRHQLFTTEEAHRAGFNNSMFFQVRGHGEYEGIAFYLQEAGLKWTLVRDKDDALCLTVERK